MAAATGSYAMAPIGLMISSRNRRGPNNAIPSAARPTTPTTTKAVRSGKAPRDEREADLVRRAAPLAAALFTILRPLTAAMKISYAVATQYGVNSSIFHDFATRSAYIRAT
jgi:hypothetical protein